MKERFDEDHSKKSEFHNRLYHVAFSLSDVQMRRSGGIETKIESRWSSASVER